MDSRTDHVAHKAKWTTLLQLYLVSMGEYCYLAFLRPEVTTPTVTYNWAYLAQESPPPLLVEQLQRDMFLVYY